MGNMVILVIVYVLLLLLLLTYIVYVQLLYCYCYHLTNKPNRTLGFPTNNTQQVNVNIR